MIPIIYKGSDSNIVVTVKDYTGEALTISDLIDVVVSAYQTKSEIIQQWKVSDSSLVIVTDNEGIVQANLDRDNTENLPCKRLYLEVKIIASNTDFESGEQVSIISDIVLADLKNSVS